MSTLGDLDTIPWVSPIPHGALSAFCQARELRRVRRSGRLSTGEAAQLLGLDPFTVSCLSIVWRASPPMRHLLRATGIAPYPAAVLVQLEAYVRAEALTLARRFAKDAVGLVELENRLSAAKCEAVKQRSGLRGLWRRLRGRRR